MADVDIPDRLKHSDLWLDFISAFKAEWETRLAGECAERAEIENLLIDFMLMAETMVHGPIDYRRKTVAAMQHELRIAGIWPPVVLPNE